MSLSSESSRKVLYSAYKNWERALKRCRKKPSRKNLEEAEEARHQLVKVRARWIIDFFEECRKQYNRPELAEQYYQFCLERGEEGATLIKESLTEDNDSPLDACEDFFVEYADRIEYYDDCTNELYPLYCNQLIEFHQLFTTFLAWSQEAEELHHRFGIERDPAGTRLLETEVQEKVIRFLRNIFLPSS